MYLTPAKYFETFIVIVIFFIDLFGEIIHLEASCIFTYVAAMICFSS